MTAAVGFCDGSHIARCRDSSEQLQSEGFYSPQGLVHGLRGNTGQTILKNPVFGCLCGFVHKPLQD